MITQINNLATLNEYFHTETGTLYKTLSAKHECVEVIRCICIHLNEFLIGHYIKQDIMRHI